MWETEARNISIKCAWSIINRTEARGTEQLQDADYLFRSLLPELAVPALICLFVLLTVFSLAVNALTLSSIGRSDDPSWQPRFTFCRNLILSDLLQTVTFGPAVIHSLIHRRTMVSSSWCYVQYFVGSASVFTSLVTITCMALERYLYVCYAIYYVVILTERRLWQILAAVWVYSISISAVMMSLLLLRGAEDRGGSAVTMGLLCEPDVLEQHMGSPRPPAIFRKFFGAFTLLLCLLVHALSYFRMYKDARNAVVPFNAVNVKARRTVVFYCGMLFLQLLPLLIKVTSDALWEFRGTGVLETSQARGDCPLKPAPTATAAALHVSLLILLLVPPCINPLVYGLRNAEVRQVLCKLLRRRRDRGALVPPPVEEGMDGNILLQNNIQAG